MDADVTLFRRVARGKRIYHAHRSHAYQQAALRYGAHKPVVVAVAVINVVWLFPIATAVALHVIDGGLALAVAYVPLIALVLGLRAGIDQPPVASPGPRA